MHLSKVSFISWHASKVVPDTSQHAPNGGDSVEFSFLKHDEYVDTRSESAAWPLP